MELQKHETEHIKKMRSLAPECMVLLKSDGTFPIDHPCEIALYGCGARTTIKGGTGSGNVNSRFYTTVEAGLENAGFTVITKDWLDAYEKEYQKARKTFVKKIKMEAKRKKTHAIVLAMGAVMPEPEYEIPIEEKGKVAIYVLSRISGEGNDRNPIEGDVFLTKTEIKDILQCQRKYEKFMLVLNVGGVVDLSPVTEVKNILLLSQLGVAIGDAFADVILGKAYPSGKLTTTWAAYDDYCKEGDFGNHKDTHYNEGIYVGYRYFEKENKKPLFAFGYGLGYTSFTLKTFDLEFDNGDGRIAVEVENTGNCAGKEVVQLYVSKTKTKLDHPLKELVAFEKTRELAPGNIQRIILEFSVEEFKSFDDERDAFVVEAGEYIISVGNSSVSAKACGRVQITEDIVIEENSTMTQPSFEAMSFVSNLSDEDLCMLCVGLHQEGKGATVIGSAAQTVSGAAGENYSAIDGVPDFIMADGPAGLRLNQKYLRVAEGTEGIMEELPEGMSDFVPGFLRFLMKQKAKKQLKQEVFYQYCTAIPIGTAIAQSWNLELAESCGDVVGTEMEHFGINLWLAPAFNIQRNILCGRNFEYYSEDPIISGRFGAAVTRGVQKHKNCGVTVKHFCCNNQETNRYMNNSVVSKRALYEIYLRAFEIAIKESNPVAVMTSYNLLNGIHTSENEKLLKGVLRTEWGYTGLIMSDWVVPSVLLPGEYYPAEKAAESIKAGNDLFMPGSTADYQDILNALQNKNNRIKLTREEVEYCAAHVVDTAWRLSGEKKPLPTHTQRKELSETVTFM